MSLPAKDRYLEGKNKLMGELAILMGGRVAEEIVYGDITSGASSDLKEATRIARLMVCSWGMSEALGPQTFGDNQELMFLGREINRTQDYSEETARKIDADVNQMLRERHGCATDIINKHRDKLDLMANLLLERETLEDVDIKEIMTHGRILSEKEREERNKEEEEKADSKPVNEIKESTASEDVKDSTTTV
jgi:cell division protease FtsH